MPMSTPMPKVPISSSPSRDVRLARLALLSLLSLLSLAAALAVTACSTRAQPAATAAVTVPPPPPPLSAATAPADGRLNLGQRLAREAASRPGGGLRVETVASALAGAGLTLGPLRQVLGRTVGARYCASARSPAGNALALCEFADEADAARGLDVSHATFDRLVPGRRLLRARNLTLTLTPAEAGPRFADEAARAASILAAL
ncbi:MAG TPA: hypothetical protein VFH68_26335 [Polyangia bacterium]|nr:hypothetical protein [Polyangia bacterium]